MRYLNIFLVITLFACSSSNETLKNEKLKIESKSSNELQEHEERLNKDLKFFNVNDQGLVPTTYLWDGKKIEVWKSGRFYLTDNLDQIFNDLSQISLPTQDSSECIIDKDTYPEGLIYVEFEGVNYSCSSGKIFNQVDKIMSHYIELKKSNEKEHEARLNKNINSFYISQQGFMVYAVFLWDGEKFEIRNSMGRFYLKDSLDEIFNDLSQISLPAQENIECNMGSHPGVTRESRTYVDIQFDELKYSCPSGKVFGQVETILSHYIELGSIEPLPDDEGI